MTGDSCAAGWERAGLLGGREYDCWVRSVGERWTPRLGKGGLLGRREVDDGCAAGWESAGLLGGRDRYGLLGG